MSRPWKVGLTGGIGSGKSLVAAMFARHGVPIIDADSIARELTSRPGPALQQIISQFGTGILDAQGKLDRNSLRSIVFSDTDARHRLESILHPLVYRQMEIDHARINAPYCILSIPLLLETDASEKVNRILVVDCPVEMQIERTCNRDKVSRQVVESIILSQVSRETRLAAADDIIVNDGSIEDLETPVGKLHMTYLELSSIRP